jgi:acyl-CoA synthetase (AMP-forming)/AMP-acid ligase II
MTTSCDLLLDRIEQNAAKCPTKTAVTFLTSGPDGGKVEKSLTYQELATKLQVVASRLLSEGIQPGDRAVLVYPPSLDYMLTFLACLKAGIVAVPVFPPNPSRRDTLAMFSSIVASSGATHALTSTSYNHLKKLAGIKDAMTRFNRPTEAWPDNLKWITTNDGKTLDGSTTSSFCTPKPSDLAFLQFTSGSTSEPKGVMITHGNLAHNLTIITNELKAVDDTVVVSWLPQYHDMGLIGSYLGCLYCGGSGYYMSPLSFLQRPAMWVEAVSKYKATHLQAPNFAFKLVARKFQASSATTLDLSSVRHVINAAEPVTEDAIDSFVQTFGSYGFSPAAIFPSYGLAEHTVFVCSGGKQRLTVDKMELETNRKVVEIESSENVSRLIGCGFPANQNVDIRIVDRETSTELAEDTVGEIWIQSDSKAAGYFEKPQETKEDFHATLEGAVDGGYLRTGDLGFLHNQELFICGRLKDLIIVGGRNYYPQDMEATAEASNNSLRPGCSAAFTIDPTAKEGEDIAIMMELREVPKDVKAVCEPIVEDIRSIILQEHSLRLSDIVLLKPKSVPKTTSGKIARAWCRKGYLANTLDVVYRKDYKKNEISALEIEQPEKVMDKKEVEKLRSMDKKELLTKLKVDVAKMGGSSPDDIAADVPIATLLDSLSVSQFKGQLEARYAVTKLSDEYLFRESCTLKKLVEVVLLGYAPDDGDDQGATAASVAQQGPGGLAGALGCPPGVVCVIL